MEGNLDGMAIVSSCKNLIARKRQLMQNFNLDQTTTTVAPAKIPNGKWVVEIEVTSFIMPDPEDHRVPVSQRPTVVPFQHWAQVCGVTRADVQLTLLTEDTAGSESGYKAVSRRQKWQVVSDKPFAVVHYRDYDQFHGLLAKQHRRLTAARQMHKGELGQQPKLTQYPQTLQSSIPDPDRGFTDKSQKFVRPNLNWVELDELSKIVGLSPKQIITGFAGFSPSTYYEPNVPVLQIISYGAKGLSRREDVTRVYPGAVPNSPCGGEYQWGGNSAISLKAFESISARQGSKFWVPQHFAYNVIRLTSFGYRPENEAPENSFRLEAPMPAPRAAQLPVLPVEELRQLHTLTAELRQELPERDFRLAAEAALGGGFWSAEPRMDDEGGGVGKYFTDFTRLNSADGRVVIAVCHWTRAGAGKSKNYYAGMLAVFPERVITDPRRDQSAILRIWFWPDSLQRLTPDGSKDGFYPPGLRSEDGWIINDFLGRLGYSSSDTSATSANC